MGSKMGIQYVCERDRERNKKKRIKLETKWLKKFVFIQHTKKFFK